MVNWIADILEKYRRMEEHTTCAEDNEKMSLRIAILGHKRIPSREGGVEVVVEELATRMVQQGHQVTCFNRKGHHVSGCEYDGEKIKEYKGIRLKTVFAVNGKGLEAMTSSVLAALYAAFGKYDVVHFHAEGSCVMLWLPKLFGKRCIATIHGLDWQRIKWGGFASRYIKLGEKIAARYADEIIVLSKGVQRYFINTYDRQTKIISNGVNRPDLYPADLIYKEFGLRKDTYVLYLGRLVPEKGVHYLIHAFKETVTSRKLVIAGGCSDTEEYIKKLKKQADGDERILFTGFVQGRILEELYSNAYLYVLPSDLEGMPLSLLEAMSYGNCCVVSNIDECTEVVEDQAVIFKKGDVVDLRKTLQGLIDDSKLVDMYRQSAADYICAKYNWEDVVGKTLSLYKKNWSRNKGCWGHHGKHLYKKKKIQVGEQE